MAHVIAFANQKGGVTKTTSTANLGVAFAEQGHKVLLIDADPQANLSEAFGVDEQAIGLRLEDALALEDLGARLPGGDAAPAVLQCLAGGVDLLPCTDQLATVAARLATSANTETRMRDLVALYRPLYDYVLIDTPPGIGPLSSLALIAADYILIPARPGDHDVGGAGKVYDLVESGALSPFNEHLRILGVLITQQDNRWRLRQESRTAIQEAEMNALPVEIPFAVRVGSAPRHGAPTIVLEPDGRVGSAYRRLAAHIDEEVGK
mgnify:CR=1 FL=1